MLAGRSVTTRVVLPLLITAVLPILFHMPVLYLPEKRKMPSLIERTTPSRRTGVRFALSKTPPMAERSLPPTPALTASQYVQSLKDEAERFFDNGEFTRSIEVYNEVMILDPRDSKSCLLYTSPSPRD